MNDNNSRAYSLAIDGQRLKKQRRLLLKLLEHQRGLLQPVLTKDEITSLEGLVNMTDSIADQAHDAYGLDTLLTQDKNARDLRRHDVTHYEAY